MKFQGRLRFIKYFIYEIIILLLIKTIAFPLMDSIQFNVAQGKEGIIDFTSGSDLLIAKAKNGHLSVVSTAD